MDLFYQQLILTLKILPLGFVLGVQILHLALENIMVNLQDPLSLLQISRQIPRSPLALLISIVSVCDVSPSYWSSLGEGGPHSILLLILYFVEMLSLYAFPLPNNNVRIPIFEAGRVAGNPFGIHLQLLFVRFVHQFSCLVGAGEWTLVLSGKFGPGGLIHSIYTLVIKALIIHETSPISYRKQLRIYK